MSLTVSAVDKNSIAQNVGIIAGDEILAINNEDLIDIIDYEFFLGYTYLVFNICRNGKHITLKIHKNECEDIGLVFDVKNIEKIKYCHNHCRFCFVDQMPDGLRKSLYIKDDDWRTSFLFGNYVTLTNLTDSDFMRIIKRNVSPLYVSVHATDDVVRNDLLFQKHTEECVMQKLRYLAGNGIRMHTQIVLCPQYNDGTVLKKTIEDLYSIYPMVQSVAVVPVGLTKYRNGLSSILPVNKKTAEETLFIIEEYANEYYKSINNHFVYASDELYIRAGMSIPVYERYDNFPQLENGIGMIADFFDGVLCAIELSGKLKYNKISVATGEDFYPYMLKIAKLIESHYNVIVTVYRIFNNFFGENVTVTGLLTVSDIIEQLEGIDLGDVLLLSESIFNKDGLSLDNFNIQHIMKNLNIYCVLTSNDGYEFIDSLRKE